MDKLIKISNKKAKELYPTQKTFQVIAKTSFIDGYNHCLRSSKDKTIVDLLKLQTENTKLKKENKELNEILNNSERLADWIGGL